METPLLHDRPDGVLPRTAGEGKGGATRGQEAGAQPSTEQLHGSLLESLVGPAEARRSEAEQGPRWTIVSAEAAGNSPAVIVGKAETIKLPFGPPFKPVVTAYRREITQYVVVGPDGKVQSKTLPDKDREVIRLSMSLVGAANEVCTNLMVSGDRPPAPKFTVKTPDGKVVLSGDFEYGCRLHLRVLVASTIRTGG